MPPTPAATPSTARPRPRPPTTPRKPAPPRAQHAARVHIAEADLTTALHALLHPVATPSGSSEALVQTATAALQAEIHYYSTHIPQQDTSALRDLQRLARATTPCVHFLLTDNISDLSSTRVATAATACACTIAAFVALGAHAHAESFVQALVAFVREAADGVGEWTAAMERAMPDVAQALHILVECDISCARAVASVTPQLVRSAASYARLALRAHEQGGRALAEGAVALAEVLVSVVMFSVKAGGVLGTGRVEMERVLRGVLRECGRDFGMAGRLCADFERLLGMIAPAVR